MVSREIPHYTLAVRRIKETLSLMSKKKNFALLTGALTMLMSSPALAQSGAEANTFNVQANAALAVGICMGLAVLGAGMGQGRAAGSALEGISRNPGAAGKIQTNMLIGLALIESLVLVAFVVCFQLLGLIG
jgi:F-type H+-transporting ATPase subunit c